MRATFALLIALCLNSAGAEDCANDILAPRFAYSEPDAAAVGTIVGSGPYTTTYLGFGDDGRLTARKRYRDRARLDNDVAAFAILGQIAVGRAAELFEVPRDPKVEPAPSPHVATLVTPFVAGRLIDDLVHDANVDPDVRRLIYRTYLKSLVAIAAHPLGRSFKVQLAMGMGGGWIDGAKILIKPNNVMVDPRTLRLTIIDPY